jgi:hypothetical protein
MLTFEYGAVIAVCLASKKHNKAFPKQGSSSLLEAREASGVGANGASDLPVESKGCGISK